MFCPIVMRFNSASFFTLQTFFFQYLFVIVICDDSFTSIFTLYIMELQETNTPTYTPFRSTALCVHVTFYPVATRLQRL